MNAISSYILLKKLEKGFTIEYHNIEIKPEYNEKRLFEVLNSNQVNYIINHDSEIKEEIEIMKTKKCYPLWLLNLLYSRFFDLIPIGGLNEPVGDWKELGIISDGIIINAKRRFSNCIDKIAIYVIKHKMFIIINKFSKVKVGE